MNLIDSRTVYGIGGGLANIYEDGAGYVVEVVNFAGADSLAVDGHDDAWKTWMHPFARGLNIPEAQERPVTLVEHNLYVALESVEAGDSDAIR